MKVMIIAHPISPTSQERFNLIVISWLFFLTVVLGFWLWNDYARVQDRKDKLDEIYKTHLDQQKRYEAILQAEEERLGLPHGKQ